MQEVSAHAHLATGVLCLPSQVSGLQVRWRGSYDEESYVSAQSLADAFAEPLEWSEVGAVTAMHIAAASLPANGTSAYMLRSCNPARNCNISSPSLPVARVSSPSAGSVELLPEATASAGYFRNPTQLDGAWRGFVTGHYLSLLSYEACVGTTKFGCQALPWTSAGQVAEAAGGSVAWRSPANLTLPCGVTYFLTVRATNCAGLQHTVTSDGAKLCCSSPRGGTIGVEDEFGEAVVFAATSAQLTVRWSGFSDACSGVRSYRISLHGTSGNASALWEASASALEEPSVSLPTPVVRMLSHGETYEVRVVATSHAGVAGESVHSKLTIDDAPPPTAVVRDGQGRSDASCKSVSLVHRCSWSLDVPIAPAAPISLIEWALGSKHFESDVRPFERLSTHATSAESQPVGTVGMTIYCTVRVTSAVNLTSVASSDGVLIVDDSTCAAPFVCMPSPWSLLMGSSIATLPSSHGPPMEQVYDVTSRTLLPEHGLHIHHTRLRLIDHSTTVDEPTARTFELVVEQNYMVDQHGSRHVFSGANDLTRHPFFFRRALHGQITSVHFHPDESERVVGVKRVLASTHQHLHFEPHASSAVTDRSWVVQHETDAVGPASAEYQLRGGAGLLRPRRVLYKRQRYHQSLSVPEGFSYEVNSTVILGNGSVPAHIKQSYHFEPTVSVICHLSRRAASLCPPPCALVVERLSSF